MIAPVKAGTERVVPVRNRAQVTPGQGGRRAPRFDERVEPGLEKFTTITR